MGILTGVVTLVALLLAWILFKPIWDGSDLKKGTAILLGVVLLVTGSLEARWLYGQSKGSEIIAAVSDNEDGYLECQRLSKTLLDVRNGARAGEVSWDRPERALLRYQDCRNLISWLADPRDRELTAEVGFAIHVLAHEAIHVSGERNEAVTECTAMQKAPEAMALLGVDEGEMKNYMSFYYANIYPNQQKAYVSEDCVDGGAMDLHPELPGFPIPNSM